MRSVSKGIDQWRDTPLGAHCAIVEALTGQDPHIYTSTPEPGDTRHVFQDAVIHDLNRAVTYAESLAVKAASDWRADNGPFDRDATREVSLWIANDEPYYGDARYIAVHDGVEAMAARILWWLESPVKGTGPWHVADALSPRDRRMIDWSTVLTAIFHG